MKRIIIIASLLLTMLPGQAQARACPIGYPVRIPHGCARVDGRGVACDSGYQGQFNRVNGHFSGRCVVGPMVQR